MGTLHQFSPKPIISQKLKLYYEETGWFGLNRRPDIEVLTEDGSEVIRIGRSRSPGVLDIADFKGRNGRIAVPNSKFTVAPEPLLAKLDFERRRYQVTIVRGFVPSRLQIVTDDGSVISRTLEQNEKEIYAGGSANLKAVVVGADSSVFLIESGFGIRRGIKSYDYCGRFMRGGLRESDVTVLICIALFLQIFQPLRDPDG